ncbi:MAG: hypothetical protein IJ221_07425 [Oscillibacter sp.]|nr:hypothetical protein [Oscillibacter sp.]
MRKPIEDMTDREILAELLAEKRRAEKWRYVGLGVRLAVLAVVAALCLRYLPPVLSFARDAYAAVETANAQVAQARQQMEGIRSQLSDLQTTAEGIRTAVAGIQDIGSAALESAADRLNDLLSRFPRLW